MAQEFSITQSLFGLNPEAMQLAEEEKQGLLRDRQAMEFARLDPMQQASYMQRSGGLQAGRALGQLAGGLLGVDTANPQVKLAQATQAVMRQLQTEGFDPNDTVGVRKELARRLAGMGFPQQAAMLAQEVQREELEVAAKRAEIGSKQAGALKSIAEAKNIQSPIDKIIATGKFNPDSIAVFKATQNPGDLVLSDPDRYGVAETAEGVFLYNKADPTDRLRLGDPKPTGSGASAANRVEFDKMVREVWSRYGAEGAEADEVFERFRMADGPGFAQLMALGKEAVGADNVMMALGASKPLTEAQGQLFDYRSAAVTAQNIIDRKGWGTKRAYPPVENDFISNLQTEATKNPNAPMTLNMVLAKVGNKETREFLADYFGALLPVLRKDTGAAIAASEWINYFNTYVPSSNANATDNESRVERFRGRVQAMDAAINADPALRARDRQLKKLQGDKNSEQALIKDGYAAKAKGVEAYRAWWAGLTPQQKAYVKAEAERLKAPKKAD